MTAAVARRALDIIAERGSLEDWNDAPERTLDDVVRLLADYAEAES